MRKRTFEVLTQYNPKKHGKVGKNVIKFYDIIRTYKTFDPADIAHKNVSLFPNYSSAYYAVRRGINHALPLGIVKEIQKSIPLNEFVKLPSVAYFASQLKIPHTRNNIRCTNSTRMNYVRLIHSFSEWLVGKDFEFVRTVQTGMNEFKTERYQTKLESVDHFLELYKKSWNSDQHFIKIIKEYLLSDNHTKLTSNYMRSKYFAIKSYFFYNDCKIEFRYNPNIHYNSEELTKNFAMSLDDLFEIMTSGQASVLQRAIIMCKFHRGLDNITFCDRFNYEAFEQICNWFGTDDYTSWDLSKCPVPTRHTRLKTNFNHTGYLEKDAIICLQKYLAKREQRYGRLRKGDAIFLNKFGNPIQPNYVSRIIPQLAERSNSQRKVQLSTVTKNEMTGHELRDLLKSTLISSGTAQYVCEHAIGHMTGDSYEKQHILYPEKSRIEYAKASKLINIFTHSKNAFAQTNAGNLQISKLEEKLETQQSQLERVIEQRNSDQQTIQRLLDEKLEFVNMFIEDMLKKNPDAVSKLAKKIRSDNHFSF